MPKDNMPEEWAVEQDRLFAEITKLRAELAYEYAASERWERHLKDIIDEFRAELTKAEAAIARVRELRGPADDHWRGPDYVAGYWFALEDVSFALNKPKESSDVQP